MATHQTTPKQESPTDVRTHRLVVYVTEADSRELFRISHLMEMSRSSLVASILERMILGGFSPLVGAKLCLQLQTSLERRGVPSKGFYFGIRPLPPLPEPELTKDEKRQLMKTLKQELAPC